MPNPLIWICIFLPRPITLIINKFQGSDKATINFKGSNSAQYIVHGSMLKSKDRSEFVNWAVPLTWANDGEIEISYPTTKNSPEAHFEIQFGPYIGNKNNYLISFIIKAYFKLDI